MLSAPRQLNMKVNKGYKRNAAKSKPYLTDLILQVSIQMLSELKFNLLIKIKWMYIIVVSFALAGQNLS